MGCSRTLNIDNGFTGGNGVAEQQVEVRVI